ncbi:MAG: hypothetical protein ABFD62_03235 [Syntrophaceae bacterium]
MAADKIKAKKGVVFYPIVIIHVCATHKTRRDRTDQKINVGLFSIRHEEFQFNVQDFCLPDKIEVGSKTLFAILFGWI